MKIENINAKNINTNQHNDLDMQIPGGELSPRPLHYLAIVDCSGSMAVDNKIQALNHAFNETIASLKYISRQNPHVKVLVRAIAFADGAKWHIDVPTAAENVIWSNLSVGGVTNMGKALAMVAVQMRPSKMSRQCLSPVLVLISDGYPTDDYMVGMQMLMAEPWVQCSYRLAIAIGRDADCEALENFICDPEIAPLTANNPETLTAYMKWTTNAVKLSATAAAAIESKVMPFAMYAPPSTIGPDIW